MVHPCKRTNLACQMLSYETQLDLKRDVVVKAYKNFSSQFFFVPVASKLNQINLRTQISPKPLFLQYSLRWDPLCSMVIAQN
jgi:tRNA (uracil-5-)-methyltransferase